MTKPSDFDIFECYIEDQRQKFIAASLITFGYQLFKTSTIIKRLDDVKEFYSRPNKNVTEFPAKFSEVLFDSVLDDIRICICFENYFKAKILLNGFLIHNVDKNRDASLYKKQSNEPVEVSEVIENKTVNELRVLKKKTKETTLNFNLLLTKKKYYKFFNVELEDIEFIKSLNSKRNRLHLLTSQRMSLSSRIVERYRSLNKLVDVDLVFLQNTLLDELDPKSKSKIPFRLL